MHSLAFVGHFLITLIALLAVYSMHRRVTLSNDERAGCGLSKWAVGGLLVGGVVFELVSLKASSPPDVLWDFLNAYYPAGQAVLNHDTAMLHDLIGKGVTGFVNIPVVAYWFVPFGWLPPLTAAVLYTALGVASTIVAWGLLVRLAGLELRERWLFGILFFANGPLLNGIKFGNLSYFILCALAGGLALLRAGRSGAAGALLGVATVIKPPLALFGFFFLFRRDLMGTVGFVLVGVVTVVLSLLLFGWAENLFWFETCILQYSHSWLSAFSVQSVSAFIIRLRPEIGIDYIDSLPRIPTLGENLAATMVTVSLFVMAVVACIRRTSEFARDEGQAQARMDLQYLLVLCLVLVSSPLSWDRYYSWLLMPTAFFLGTRPPFPASRIMRGLGWMAIALVTPLVMRPLSLEGLGQLEVFRFVVSRLLFGGLIWFGLVGWWLAQSGGLLAPSSTRRAIELPRTDGSRSGQAA